MAGNIHDDEYVANLLDQDAKSAKKKYELVGIDAFNPKRSKSGAPKPNTNFLRHIIRQTDSHNSALLAKEAEESHARLKRMNAQHERERNTDKGVQRSRFYDKDENAHSQKLRKRQRDGSLESRSTSHRHSSRHRRRETRRHEDSEEDQAARRSRRSRHDHEQRRYSSEEADDRSRRKATDRRHKRRRSTSRSRSRSPRSDKHRRKDRHRHRSRSPTPKSRHSGHISSKPAVGSRKSKRSASPASDSDPLEAIVGPLPPPAQPVIRSRGRGAHKANGMDIDSHFSTTYDPSVDVRQASDAEDDWGNAVESFRDRQRWKQQGADRLKAAGFTDDQVKKWGKGDEKSEEDVVWTRKGQAREWDRGKVVDEDGDVELKADWGRLK
ncbi:hypothetical protein P153DRAFT_383087 [Dothidotthia symphoricarpi CBS 119687]|uniref:Pre-mRNA-splicing factor 38B n=1 Tax=Dothidotthia symphoricarpi CBS 119687 TaxID=1392245 RepID=A0A6A6AK56_9PLEO|nr:uncharacterized protein P153DRAFT_383087 [Dothidotthia symphoricarpi CBS 119687]KAF2132200.1 hypothetical protein P153DRAFT_383087 [Dothidotthia symphoricarpi CBS 119687]